MSGNPRRRIPHPSASGDRDSAGLSDHDHRSRRGNQAQPSTSSQGGSQDPPHYQPQSSVPALIGTPAQLETHRAMRQEVAAQQPAAYVSPYGSTALIGTPAQLETHRAMRQEVAAQQPAAYVSPYGSTQPDIGGQQPQSGTNQTPPWTNEEVKHLRRVMDLLPRGRVEELAHVLNNGRSLEDISEQRRKQIRINWDKANPKKAGAKGVAKSKPGDKPPDKKT